MSDVLRSCRVARFPNRLHIGARESPQELGFGPMSLVRWITEMGMGVDVHGGDYTKAARRAVSDALRHSSLNFFEAAGKTVHDMHVKVVICLLYTSDAADD